MSAKDNIDGRSDGLDCCFDWLPGIEAINDIIILSSVRADRDVYNYKPFRFCPWCGAPKTQKGTNV